MWPDSAPVHFEINTHLNIICIDDRALLFIFAMGYLPTESEGEDGDVQ